MSEANFNAYEGPIFANGTGVSTLDSPVYMTPFIAPDKPVRQLMDTQNKNGEGFLCYVYEDNPDQKPPRLVVSQ